MKGDESMRVSRASTYKHSKSYRKSNTSRSHKKERTIRKETSERILGKNKYILDLSASNALNVNSRRNNDIINSKDQYGLNMNASAMPHH